MVFAIETEDVLQAWALPIENSIGVGGFDLALAANPLTSGVGREGSLGCSASSVPEAQVLDATAHPENQSENRLQKRLGVGYHLPGDAPRGGRAPARA